MGPPINQYAFGDIQALVATIDRVIAWDDGHADDYATRKAREDVKAGLKKMRDDVTARQDEIRRTRSQNGLPKSQPLRRRQGLRQRLLAAPRHRGYFGLVAPFV